MKITKRDRAFLRDLGRDAKKIRKDLGLTFRDASKKSGVGVGSIYEMEKGKSNPSFLLVRRLYEGYGAQLVVQARINKVQTTWATKKKA